jgi:IS4 transposase
LVTNRLDLDAELVALAYRYRWAVELFFRWLR